MPTQAMKRKTEKAERTTPSPAAANRPVGAVRPRSPLTPELEAELAAIAAGAGCELLAAEWKGGTLRLILDRPEPSGAHTADLADGVSVGDCERVAKQASALLDVADFGGGRYVLEVSSPGLDRQLYRPSDYRRFRGRRARVSFDDPATGGKRTVVGRLEGLDEEGGSVTLALETAPAPRPVRAAADARTAPVDPPLVVIPLHTIRLARLEIELERTARKR